MRTQRLRSFLRLTSCRRSLRLLGGRSLRLLGGRSLRLLGGRGLGLASARAGGGTQFMFAEEILPGAEAASFGMVGVEVEGISAGQALKVVEGEFANANVVVGELLDERV